MSDMISTNLQGRLRNTKFAKSNILFPIFEAVVNAIQSIDDGVGSEKGEVVVRVIRDTKGFDFGKDNPSPIVGFEISDNGVGFTEENFDSFKTLDSSYKLSKGCKGMGRLLWLKVFDIVHVESSFFSENLLKRRSFVFSETLGISENNVVDYGGNLRTIVKMEGVKNSLSKVIQLKTEKIASAILQHCLWYFLRKGGCAQIVVKDDKDEFNLNLMYDEMMLSQANTQSIEINEEKFELTSVRLNSKLIDKHALVLCAALREVKVISLKGKINGLFGAISNNESEPFYLYTFITSEYLDKHVSSERDCFDLPEKPMPSFLDDDISLEEIEKKAIDCVKNLLDDSLKENLSKIRNKIDSFVQNKAPQYRPFVNDIVQEDISLDPNCSEEAIDSFLHKKQYEAEEKLSRAGRDLMSLNVSSDRLDEYEKSLNEYMGRASEIKQADLAKYVTHRRVVLDILNKVMGIQDDGKFVKEKVIHNLVFPMKKTSDDRESASNNLWLIDERLAFHNYMASDKRFDEYEIAEIKDADRPDILALQMYDNPILTSEKNVFPLTSVTVIEFKRPMRNDMTSNENPIDQVLNYLMKIRSGSCKMKNGQLIPKSESMPGYCYVIADLTESLAIQCGNHGLVECADHMGFFGYIPQRQAYVEVISFNKLYSAALERNQAFFAKLGLPNC